MVLDRIEKDNLTMLSDDVLENYERLVPDKMQLRNSIEVLQLEYEGLLTLNQEIHHHKILNLYNGPFRKEQPR
ncbi:MAG: hypothetical protein EOO07_18990 [Chitinophagaceae bacterium]|nr:MAG: hypothetical protein EOO07_18990 [Chitinophagaceae bacterium]